MQCTIFMTVSGLGYYTCITGFGAIYYESKCRSSKLVFHYLAGDMYGAHILKKEAVLRTLIHEQLQLAEHMY